MHHQPEPSSPLQVLEAVSVFLCPLTPSAEIIPHCAAGMEKVG